MSAEDVFPVSILTIIATYMVFGEEIFLEGIFPPEALETCGDYKEESWKLVAKHALDKDKTYITIILSHISQGEGRYRYIDECLRLGSSEMFPAMDAIVELTGKIWAMKNYAREIKKCEGAYGWLRCLNSYGIYGPNGQIVSPAKYCHYNLIRWEVSYHGPAILTSDIRIAIITLSRNHYTRTLLRKCGREDEGEDEIEIVKSLIDLGMGREGKIFCQGLLYDVILTGDVECYRLVLKDSGSAIRRSIALKNAIRSGNVELARIIYEEKGKRDTMNYNKCIYWMSRLDLVSMAKLFLGKFLTSDPKWIDIKSIKSPRISQWLRNSGKI